MSEVLGCAYDHAHRWLNDLDTGDVCETARVDDLRAAYLVPLPQYGTDVAQVVDHLATASYGGLLGSLGGWFFSWVISGGLPSALAADWLVSAWDQITAFYA